VTTTVQKTITVDRPVNTVYNQWTQFARSSWAVSRP
jgi:uncharacterized membrane protein